MPTLRPIDPSGVEEIFEHKKRLTKEDLALLVSTMLNCSQIKAIQSVNAVIAALSDSFVAGKDIELRGFGVFRTKIRRGHLGRNPITNTPVPIPDHWMVKFTPSKIVDKLVNLSLGKVS